MHITKRLEFDAGHRVLGHEGKCRHIHGHRYAAEITVDAPALDSLGRVIDFGVIKAAVGGWVDRNWDHNLLLHPSDVLANAHLTGDAPPAPADTDAATMQEIGRRLYDGRKPYVMPNGNPTAENIAGHLWTVASAILKTESPLLRLVNVRIYETPTCWADCDREPATPGEVPGAPPFSPAADGPLQLELHDPEAEAEKLNTLRVSVVRAVEESTWMRTAVDRLRLSMGDRNRSLYLHAGFLDGTALLGNVYFRDNTIGREAVDVLRRLGVLEGEPVSVPDSDWLSSRWETDDAGRYRLIPEGPVVENDLRDGMKETHEHHLRRSISHQEAAEAPVGSHDEESE